MSLATATNKFGVPRNTGRVRLTTDTASNRQQGNSDTMNAQPQIS